MSFVNIVLGWIGLWVASLIVYSMQGLLALHGRFNQRISKINNRTVIRWNLDAGLAGNDQARHRYNHCRIISYRDAQPWAIRLVEADITATRRTPPPIALLDWETNLAVRAHYVKFLASGVAEVEKNLLRFFFFPGSSHIRARIGQVTMRSMLLSIEHSIDQAEQKIVNPSTAQRLMISGMRASRHRLLLFRELYDRMNAVLNASAWLEDFLSLHPCPLEDPEKQTIIHGYNDPWELANQPMIQRILEAESELGELFDRYELTIDERGLAVRRLMRSTITKSSLRKVSEWVATRRQPPASSPTPIQATTPASPATVAPPTICCPPPIASISVRDQAKRFARSLRSLARNEQNRVMHLLLLINNQGLANVDRLIAQLEHHPETDLLPYLELRYHELSARVVEVETPTAAIRPVVKPKLPPEETADELLNRMASAEKISYTDIPRLRSLTNSGLITAQRLDEALTHLLCFKLAHGSSSLTSGVHRPYRIHLHTVVPRYSPPGLEPQCEAVVRQMISQGMLVDRQTNGRPGISDRVKLSPATMHKYRPA